MLALIMYALMLRSFSDGFMHYVEKTESQKLIPFINAITLIYEEQGHWDWAKTQQHQWRFLVDKHIREMAPSLHNPARQPPPHTLHPRDHNRPHQRPPPPRDRQNHKPQGNRFLVVDTHIYLKDKLNQLIIGNPKQINTVHWIPMTKAGETLGYIGYAKKNILSNQLDTLFVEEQQRNFLLIALSLIFLSALIALPAASLFLRPLNRVSKMLAKIAKGDYTKRLKIISRDEIGDLGKDLNSLTITLEKNLHARQQWVADISHELRTPVAILKGEIEAMQDGIRRVTDTTLSSLQHEIERLTRLINDLHELTLADIGALSYQKEVLNFCDLLQDRVDTQKNNLHQRAIRVTVNCSNPKVKMIGDAKRLEQLIDNLLQNTIRYTDKSGFLNISLVKKTKGCTLIWEDSSPGVSDVDLVKLTDPLYRAEQSRNRNTGGSGLGLAICKKIVEAHQGVISITHSTLGGIAIKITFPN